MLGPLSPLPQLIHLADRFSSPRYPQCAAFYCLSCAGLSWALSMMQRGEIRQKYNLPGSGCGDCVRACCCAPCDLLQQDKEVTYREQLRMGETQTINIQPGKIGNMQYGNPQ